jgi:spore germination cell wall hydrolase CwlJ-like protein
VSRVAAGQVVAVRLHHPASGNQIDEPMYAHCAERGLMMFELVRNRDTYMRAKTNGKIGVLLSLSLLSESPAVRILHNL